MFSTFLKSSPAHLLASILCAAIVLASTASAQTAEQQTPAQALAEIQALVKQKQMTQAMAKADQFITANPRNAEGYFVKGTILMNTGRSADAMAVFGKLTEDFPELPEPYNNLAVLYAQQKQYDKARAALEMAIRANPDYAAAYENLGDIYAKLASQAYGKTMQLDAANKTAPSKLARIKEAIAPTPPANKP